MADFLISASFIASENYQDTETLPVNGAQMWLFQDYFVHYFCFQKGQVCILQNAPVDPVAKVHTQYRLRILSPFP